MFVWVRVIGRAYWLLASGEFEVQSAAFEHDETDEVVEAPVSVAHFDGGLDVVAHGLQSGVGETEAFAPRRDPVWRIMRSSSLSLYAPPRGLVGTAPSRPRAG